MQFLHTMFRVTDLEKSLDFYCNGLGLQELSRKEYPQGKFTLIFLASSQDIKNMGEQNCPMLELTYNWEPEVYTEGRNFGHVAFRVDDIYKTCQNLLQSGEVINRPPRDGHMAFVRSPDNISIELLQKGKALEPEEPWISMLNQGVW